MWTYCTLLFIYIYIYEINMIQQRHIKLINIDIKDIYVTKDFYVK